MSITKSRLQQIIKEEVQRATRLREGYPNTMGYRGTRHYDSPSPRRRTMGGRDEYDDFGGGGPEFMQQWSTGDVVMTGEGSMATVVSASEVDSAVRIRFEDGTMMTIDGDYLERA